MADKKSEAKAVAERLQGIEKRLKSLERHHADGGNSKNNSAQSPNYCSQPLVPERPLPAGIHPGRLALIRVSEKKWVNATVLHYYFFDRDTDGETVFFSDGTSERRTWTTSEEEKDVVREAFGTWKEVGIGLEFREVNSREDAEIRIGFMRGDGAWSYVGRDVLGQGTDDRTMNFGWDLTRHESEFDTALHEIGHTLGFPHEHQNPNAGIVWSEEAVYEALAKPPNNWSREKTFFNIIRKIDPDTVQGSNWDPDSIMHYPFGAGLIEEPAEYADGLIPDAGLSARDVAQIRFFYPPVERAMSELRVFEPQFLSIAPGEQKNFSIVPNRTRYFNIRTFGESDTVMVLFEDDGGELRYLEADDDSGTDFNASIRRRLLKGKRYVIRLRLYYAAAADETAVMLW